MKNWLYLLAMLLLASCSGYEKSIDVYYMAGTVEYDRPINDFEQYKAYARSFEYTDTIYITEQEYSQMRSCLNKVKNLPCNGVSVFFVKCDTLELCLQTDYRDRIYPDSIEHSLYTIKALMGYYDWFDNDDLNFYPEIRKYGVPKRRLPRSNVKVSFEYEVGMPRPKGPKTKVLMIVK